jgi:hypothetical protein
MVRKGYNVQSLRNLPQYKDLTDQEFDKEVKGLLTDDAEGLAQTYQELFEKDYSLEDLKANDRLAVEILSRLYAQVRYNQDLINELRDAEDGVKYSLAISDIVADDEKLIRSIKALEGQLGISRTERMKDEGEDMVDMFKSIRERAKKYLEKKLHYIYCPKCHMLLGNVWLLYRDVEGAYELKLVCKREQKGGICNTEVIIRPGDLDEDTSKAIRP